MHAPLLVLVLLAQAPVHPPPAAVASGAETSWVTVFRGALETSALSFPSGTPGGGQDFFGVVTPILAVDAGDDFGFELGAPLRLRLADQPPLQKATDVGGVLRGADWDQRSDFGQILRSLRVGADGSAVFVRAGSFLLETLGHGHLVDRYSNQTNPDYHPAGATLTLNLGPTHTEVFASDILAARIVAAEVSLDLGRAFFSAVPEAGDRYHLALSAAHDFGLSVLGTSPISLVAVDVDAGIFRGEGFRADGYVNLSGRVLDGPTALGGAAGLRGEGAPGGVDVGGRLEVRKQEGGFRDGLFGPDYELARFAATGLNGPGAAEASLPDSGSGFAELQIGAGPIDADDSREGRLSLSAGTEVFFWGRVDADLAVAARTPGNRGVLTLRATLTGANQSPRVDVSGEFRYRFFASIYALAAGGTVYFPQPDHSLVRGYYGQVGLGFDFER